MNISIIIRAARWAVMCMGACACLCAFLWFMGMWECVSSDAPHSECAKFFAWSVGKSLPVIQYPNGK